MSNALVIHPFVKTERVSRGRSPEACLEEAVGLAEAISLHICRADLAPMTKPRPATLLGGGKIEELGEWIAEHEIELVIVDAHLTPIQQRNLERAWDSKVIDRTALILEIFGERAATREGKLQVELAALNYQKSRLVRSWTHLERQRGGLGFVGGPGESQIELDRRMIRDRIALIKKQLEKVVRTRGLHRKVRHETPYPLVALVGYTNAGKSTLFNLLTQAEVYAEDALFATLDPTIRKLTLPSGMEIMLSDTVGFISDLPTDLIAAFRATLEEVLEADLILHVRDISHPDSTAQKKDVEAVLADLFGEEEMTPIIEVHNKIDQLEEVEREEMLRHQGAAFQFGAPVAISAVERLEIDYLQEAIDSTLSGLLLREQTLTLPYSAGKAIAWLHEHGHVISTEDNDDGLLITVKLSPANQARFYTLFQQKSASH
jgi:GTP-binding protein HflX